MCITRVWDTIVLDRIKGRIVITPCRVGWAYATEGLLRHFPIGISTSVMHHSNHGIGTMLRELKKIISCWQLKQLSSIVQLRSIGHVYYSKRLDARVCQENDGSPN